MSRRRGEKHHAAARAEARQELLDEEVRRPNIDREQTVEILDCHFLNEGELRNSCISDQHIEPTLDDATHVEREFLRPLCCRKIGCDGLCAAAVALDLIDHRVGLARGAAVMDQHPSASFPEGQSRCATDTA